MIRSTGTRIGAQAICFTQHPCTATAGWLGVLTSFLRALAFILLGSQVLASQNETGLSSRLASPPASMPTVQEALKEGSVAEAPAQWPPGTDPLLMPVPLASAAEFHCPSGAQYFRGVPFPRIAAEGLRPEVVALPPLLKASGAKVPKDAERRKAGAPDRRLAQRFRPAARTPGAGNAWTLGSGVMPDDAATLKQRPVLVPQPRQGVHRLAIWGDSHFASGAFIAQLAKQLALEGIQVGTSFIPPYLSRRGVRVPVRAFCLSEGWSFRAFYPLDGTISTGPAFGEMHVQAPKPPSVDPSLGMGQGPEPDTAISPRSAAPDPAAADSVRLPWFALDLRKDARQSEVRGLRMLYRAPSGGLVLAVAVNDEPERLIRSADDGAQARVMQEVIRPNAGEAVATLRIRVLEGEFAWQGFALEPEESTDLWIDVFAFPGATVRAWAVADSQDLVELMREVRYDAVMLEYGTNEAAGAFNSDGYAALLHQALGSLRRVFPDAPCLLIGTPDRGSAAATQEAGRTSPSGRSSPSSRSSRSVRGPATERMSRSAPGPRSERTHRLRHAWIHKQVNSIQALIGAQYGCLSWDWQLAMGGAGSAGRWARAAPALMSRDLIHLTAEGYRQSAILLARKLGWGLNEAPR